MPRNYGPDVSYVLEDQGYNYDMVIFQKGIPPLDSELNLAQQLQLNVNQRMLSHLPSGWVTVYPASTSTSLENSFYTQDPSSPKREIALVNGIPLHITNTATTVDNLNIVQLSDPPATGNEVNGVFLEMWRALLDPDTDTNKPDPASIIESLKSIYMYDEDNGWIVGGYGLVLATQNGGLTWTVQDTDTNYDLQGIHFISSMIGWAAGDNGTILRTSSGGTSWTNLTQVTTENLHSVFATSQLVVWAVGDNGTILKATNGVSFSNVSSGVTVDLNKIYFKNSLVGWIVGDSGTILKTNNGGSTWSLQTSGVTDNLNSIYFYDLNYGFAVGDNGTILRTSDGGSSWVDQSGNIYDGSYSRLTQNLNDIHMVPSMDRRVSGEEVSSQMTGSNNNFTVENTPITIGDGKGTITNNPADVTVTVNGIEVNIDSVNGTTGVVVLGSTPLVTDTVKVSYWYRGECAVFTGKAWAVGDGGKIIYTDDIGANWVEQTSTASYNLNSVRFTDDEKGWVCGDQSVIRHTENGGVTWATQQSQVVTREMQRVYNEGNTATSVYLEDNSIHPDANVETTKRVQVQYKIRVVDTVDPVSNPEAGLSVSITGLGPNATGSFGYENMGPINGDYGLWRAKCNNTVDGYVYAIPMFFVSRRNTTAYDPDSNPNGNHTINSANGRPDRLFATQVAATDILDVRRKVVFPDPGELLERNFDSLSRNELKTKLGRALTGSTRYGTELLQTDRVGGNSSMGGTQISGSLDQAAAGTINSESTILTTSVSVPSDPSVVPTEQTLTATGVFHPDVSRYSAVYVGSIYDGLPVPGYFEKVTDNQIKFVFRSYAYNSTGAPGLTEYLISADYIATSSFGLTYVPSTPYIAKNISGSGSASMYYQGVLGSSEGTVTESWDSGLTNYPSYAKVYPLSDSTDEDQQKRASNVVIHDYKLLTTSDTTGGNQLTINPNIRPVSGDSPYTIFNISQINNITSGFSYKLTNLAVDSSGFLEIHTVSGFPFIPGTVIEIVGSAQSSLGDTNTRNGASVSLSQATKKISDFCKSEMLDATGNPTNTITLTASNAYIKGLASTETIYGLDQNVCWVNRDSSSDYVMAGILNVQNIDTTAVTLTLDKYLDTDATVTTLTGLTVKTQALLNEIQLTYNQSTDGLLIGYDYIPYQSVSGLPATLEIEIVAQLDGICISNAGAGGGTTGEPYLSPILHIPFNDADISNEGFFSNLEPLRFSNITITGGFAKMPTYVPGSFGNTITLSTATSDALGRFFYQTCSKELAFRTEGLQIAVPRKAYLPVIAKVASSANNQILKGEYLLVILSNSFRTETDNYTGYQTGSNSVIAVYRLPNKPISRV